MTSIRFTQFEDSNDVRHHQGLVAFANAAQNVHFQGERCKQRGYFPQPFVRLGALPPLLEGLPDVDLSSFFDAGSPDDEAKLHQYTVFFIALGVLYHKFYAAGIASHIEGMLSILAALTHPDVLSVLWSPFGECPFGLLASAIVVAQCRSTMLIDLQFCDPPPCTGQSKQ